LGSNFLDLKGQLTVREFMAVVAASQVLVLRATGPAHMAAGLELPTVSIYDLRRNNAPLQWRPLGKGLLLRPDVMRKSGIGWSTSMTSGDRLDKGHSQSHGRHTT
jgi:heptosyltransferase-2